MERIEAMQYVEYYLRELTNLEKQRKRIYNYLVELSKKYQLDVVVS